MADAPRSLLETGNLSDCTIKCGQKIWKVHRFVICTQSAFFKGALEGHFKVRCQKDFMLLDSSKSPQEAYDKQIDLSAEDPSILNTLIELLYGDELLIGDEGIIACAKVYALAKRLDVESVAKVAAIEFDDMWSLADFAHVACELVAIAYSLPEEDRTLRDWVVSSFAESCDDLFEDCHEEIKSALESNGTFAYEVMAKMREKHMNEK